ncbi:MAG TPA: site-2 protease family protein [Terriglobia bacterium]|nr:site-2 protease family protein [Terriglobia bacterium]
MRWAWKIGKLAGIDVYMHATFLLLMGFIVVASWTAGHNAAQAISGLIFVMAIFGCIVLHELGHALTARRFGIRTRDIVLLPIGGVARLERMPEEPNQELFVALAGPAVNVVIATSIFVLLGALGRLPTLREAETVRWTGQNFVPSLMAVNVWLFLFNLIPAFPMDGGRVLRALLARRMEYTDATQVAAHVGQAIALLFGFLGFFLDPFLLFVALFVWMGASGEAGLVQMRSSLGGIPVQRVMLKDFRALQPDDTLAQAVEYLLAGWQQDFPVVFGDRLLGVLTREDLIRAITQDGTSLHVRKAMRHDFQIVDSHDMLEQAVQVLQQSGSRFLPVEHNGGLVGMLTLENVGEFMMIRSALRHASQQVQATDLSAKVG